MLGPQFENHINSFKQQTGITLLGQHMVVGDQVVPTVRQNLTTKQKNGKTAYYLEATIPGEEGNHHQVMVNTLGDAPFYGLSLSENARHRAIDAEGKTENLDTNDLIHFSRNLESHLKKASFTPPSKHAPDIGIPMSEKDVVSGHLDEWHRKGKLRTVQVNDWDSRTSETRAYDPVTEKYV